MSVPDTPLRPPTLSCAFIFANEIPQTPVKLIALMGAKPVSPRIILPCVAAKLGSARSAPNGGPPDGLKLLITPAIFSLCRTEGSLSKKTSIVAAYTPVSLMVISKEPTLLSMVHPEGVNGLPNPELALPTRDALASARIGLWGMGRDGAPATAFWSLSNGKPSTQPVPLTSSGVASRVTGPIGIGLPVSMLDSTSARIVRFRASTTPSAIPSFALWNL